MAHNTHRVPWSTFASMFRPKFCDFGGPERSDLIKRQGSDVKDDDTLDTFITALADAIHKDTAAERQKYPDSFEAKEVVLSAATLNKMLPTIRRWHFLNNFSPDYEDRDDDGTPLQDRLIPMRLRRTEAFLELWKDSNNLENWARDLFVQLELLKTLVVHGEMATVLHICSEGNAHFPSDNNRRRPYCDAHVTGWRKLYTAALRNYILLNVLYLFPQTWEADSSLNQDHDYRDLGVYQRTVFDSCGLKQRSQIFSFIHRRFFDIHDDQFMDYRNVPANNGQAGLASFQDVLYNERQLFPPTTSMTSLQTAYKLLCARELPPEVTRMILDLVSGPLDEVRSLEPATDPFHYDNRAQLKEYLERCWRLVINCNMTLKAIRVNTSGNDEKEKTEWERQVRSDLFNLFPSLLAWVRRVTAFGYADIDGL